MFLLSWRRGLSSSVVSRCCSLHHSDPACLHCLCTVFISVRVMIQGEPPWGGMEGWAPPRPDPDCPSGELCGCHLLAEPGSEPVCHDSDRLGRGQWLSTGWGCSGDNRCLLKPQGTSLKESSSSIPLLLSCNWWRPDSFSLRHITTVWHVTF